MMFLRLVHENINRNSNDNSMRIKFPTCLFLTGDGDTGVRTAHTNGVLSLDSEAVCLALLQSGDVDMVVADSLECDPVGLALFLVLNNKAGDFTSTGAVGPLPCQPHFCLVCISVVEVLGGARRI